MFSEGEKACLGLYLDCGIQWTFLLRKKCNNSFDIFFDYGWLGVLINKNVALLDKTETYTMYVEFNLWEIASFNSLKLPPAQVLSCKSFSHK